MAYLAVNEALDFALAPSRVAALAPVAAPAAPKAKPAGFTALEWSVVMLARHDRPSSLREPGRVGKLLGAIFGESYNRRLADPKLEALRRMAVLTWHHGYAVTIVQIDDFFAAGFSADHYDLLGRRIAEVLSTRLFRK
ncbi:hypothetical protein [Sphingopyxis sp. KK2]|uniref:hypothetical protein n=1 Tax=Sphingopyxis sp. KK2 TaxID=1855727 RepID=UPI00097E58F8|nr:hypothetical protein [Sphingopyxis sp. KK2]